MTVTAIHGEEPGAHTRSFDVLDSSFNRDLTAFLIKHADKNVYFQPNASKELTSNKLDKLSVDLIRFLHVDIDPDKNIPFEEARQYTIDLAENALGGLDVVTPTFATASGSGSQLIFRLATPLEATSANVNMVEALNRSLAQHFGGDSSATDVSRLLRAPYTLNHMRGRGKAGRPKTLATLIGKTPARADLAAFDLILPPDTKHAKTKVDRLPINDNALSSNLKDAKRYVDFLIEFDASEGDPGRIEPDSPDSYSDHDSNQQWEAIATALCHASNGTEAGWELLDMWSQRDTASYDEKGQNRARWDSYAQRLKAGNLNKVRSLNSLRHFAEARGFQSCTGSGFGPVEDPDEVSTAKKRPLKTPFTNQVFIDSTTFPAGVLPDGLARYATQRGLARGVDADSAKFAFFAGIATMIPAHVRVNGRDDFSTGTNIFAGLIANSGEAKTGMIKAALSPIDKKLEADIRELEAKKAAWEKAQAVPKPKMGRPRKYLTADEALADEDPKQSAAELPDDEAMDDDGTPIAPLRSAPLVAPTYEGRVITSYSAEALRKRLATCKTGVIVRVDELSSVLSGFGQYSGAKHADESVLLSAYDNEPIVNDRVSQEIITAAKPHLSLIGGIQPDTLKLYFEQHAQSGLMQRFAFSFIRPIMPDILAPVADEDKERHMEAGRLLLEMGPAESRLSEEASRLWAEFSDRETHMRRERASTDFQKGALAKLRGSALRIALTVHCMDWAWQQARLNLENPGRRVRNATFEISGSDMQRALTYLREYVIPNISIAANIGNIGDHALCKLVVSVAKANEGKFSLTRCAARFTKFRGSTGRQVFDTALAIMLSNGWATETKNGWYELHPDILNDPAIT